MKTIVFDIETQKGFNEIPNKSNVWDMLLASCVTYCYEEDEYKFWSYTKKDDLLAYLNGNKLIGFNSINFDMRCLLGPDVTINDDFTVESKSRNFKCYNVDIYLKIQQALANTGKPVTYRELMEFMKKTQHTHRGLYSLNTLAVATLGNTIKKNGKGELAPELLKQKRIIELYQYNLQDVRVTKKLYEFIKKFGYVVNGNYDIVKL